MCECFRLTLFCIKKISEVQTIPLIRERPRALTKPFEKKYIISSNSLNWSKKISDDIELTTSEGREFHSQKS